MVADAINFTDEPARSFSLQIVRVLVIIASASLTTSGVPPRFITGQVNHLSKRFERTFDIRDLIVNDYLHP